MTFSNSCSTDQAERPLFRGFRSAIQPAQNHFRDAVR